MLKGNMARQNEDIWEMMGNPRRSEKERKRRNTVRNMKDGIEKMEQKKNEFDRDRV